MNCKNYRSKNPNSKVKLAHREEYTPALVARDFIDVTLKNNQSGKATLWGLPVGPVDIYKPIVEIFDRDDLDFTRVKTFNLDEYLDNYHRYVEIDKWYSFRGMMERCFFGLPGNLKNFIRLENIHFPDPGNIDAYPEMILGGDGLDIAYLGMGLNGHIAFNEPPEREEEYSVAEFAKLTARIVRLTPRTIVQNFRHVRTDPFLPVYAVTMGMKEILSAKKILMRATGWDYDILKKALLGPVTPMVPASYLQLHDDCTFILDKNDFNDVVEE